MEKNASICMEDYSYKGQLLHAARESEVYKATNKHNPSLSPYIFKGYLESYLTDPIREAKLMRELNSLWKLHGKQHIVQIVSQHSRDAKVFIILEFCEGGDLQQQIGRQGTFSQQKCIAYIQQIIKGYSHIHEAALIHRNLEPSSILSSAFQLKIGDFSECIKQSDTHTAEMRQEIVGNLHYHPYQTLQNYKYSVKSDIYSIGAILFCMLTGRPPFQGSNKSEIIKQMHNQTHKSIISRLKNKKLSQFLLKTLQRDESWRMGVQQLIQFDFQLMPQLNKLKLYTFDDKDSILVQQQIHPKKPAMENIRETSRERQLEQSMRILFRNFEASEHKGEMTQQKLSMIDLKVSDQGELSRLYKDREISIFIPTKMDLPQQQESQMDNLGLQQIESIEKRPSEGLPLKKRAGTSRDISNNTYCDLLKSQVLSKKKAIQTAKNLKIQQTQAQLKDTNMGSQKMHQSKAPSIKEEIIVVPPLLFTAEKTTNRIPQVPTYGPKTTERSNLKGPLTLRGREKVVDEVGRVESKSSNIAGWLISQIDMFRFLNRVIFKIKKENRPELDSLSSSLGTLKSQILREVRELTHLSRQERAYFQNSPQYCKIKQIFQAYESKMGQVNGQFQGYQKLNRTVLQSIDLTFKSISSSTQFRQSQVKLLDYLITLWQLLKLLKRNNPEYFHSKSKILEIIDATEVKLTVAHLLHIYQRMKALKLI